MNIVEVGYLGRAGPAPGEGGLTTQRKLRTGMIGRGRGAIIGAVHRAAAELDGLVEIVAGALSSVPERALASGRD